MISIDFSQVAVLYGLAIVGNPLADKPDCPGTLLAVF